MKSFLTPPAWIGIVALVISCVALTIELGNISRNRQNGDLRGPIAADAALSENPRENLLEAVVADRMQINIRTALSNSEYQALLGSLVAEKITGLFNSMLTNRNDVVALIADDEAPEAGDAATEKTPVDVSGIFGTKEKIQAILDALKDEKSEDYDIGPFVKQITAMGEDAVQPLADMLKSCGSTNILQASRSEIAIQKSLSQLLTDKNKDVILENFRDKTMFTELILKYRFSEAEDMVMEKIRTSNAVGWNLSHDSEAIIDAALLLNTERAVPLLMDYIRRCYGGIDYAAKRLACIPGLDITEPLREVAKNSKSPTAKSNMLELYFERGMPEGFDIALEILGNNSRWHISHHETIMRLVGNYTGAMGTREEMLEWLKNNKSRFVWNPNIRKFELPQ